MIELEPSFILHIRPFKETSAIIDFFTKNHGRVSSIAKGVKRKNSKFRGITQPFMPLVASFLDKNSLFTLTDLEQNGRIMSLTGIKLLSGLYLNELLIKLLPQAYPYPELFLQYQETLNKLEKNENIEKDLRFFEKNLLKAIGYEISLKNEAISYKEIESDLYYEYIIGEGPVQYKHNISGSNLNKVKVNLYLGQSLLDLGNNNLNSDKSLKQAKMLMRNLINFYLDGKQLNVRKMF